MNNKKFLPIQMYDPKRDYNKHKDEYENAVKNVMESGLFINGPVVKKLEDKLVDYIGTKHAIGVSSGTDALLISLMALDIGPGDEVITVAFTWISTAEVIVRIGAKPVFVDIDEDTFCLDADLIEKQITEKTKAIMPVSLYGNVPDYYKINQIAKKYGLPVIEDGAQSFGAKIKIQNQNLSKNMSCGVTTIGCTSFFPSKTLGGYGDGGMCFTNNDDLAIKIRSIKNHGMEVDENQWLQ